MIVRFHSIGGFAPEAIGCELDTQRLPPEEARELESLVASSGILALEDVRSSGVCDGKRLLIEIVSPDARHKVSIDQVLLPEKLGPLVGFLLARSHNLLDDLGPEEPPAPPAD